MTYASSDTRIQLVKDIQAKANREVVIVFIDISESTSHQRRVGVGPAIDRMVSLSYSLIRNLKPLESLVKFEPNNIVRSIGDELMLALPLPNDRVQRSELLVRLVEALNRTIVEEEQLGIDSGKLIALRAPQKSEVQVYKISIGVCQELVSGVDVLELIKTIDMNEEFRQRIFRPEDFWGTDVNQTARITGLSGNKIILLNGRAQELIGEYKGTKSFSCTGLYSFAAKGLGEMSVSQVIQETDETFPHIVRKYGYCCLLFIDIQGFELKEADDRERITRRLISVMEKNFSAPTLAFGYQLNKTIRGKLKESGLDFVFAVMAQDFEKYQSKVGAVIDALDENPCSINYTISYPLWDPFGEESQLSHPFFQYTKGEISRDVPDYAIISMAAFGSTKKAIRFRDVRNSAPDDDTVKLWNVFGDVDVVGIHDGNSQKVTERFRREMEEVDSERDDKKYQMFWEAERIFPVAPAASSKIS